MLFNRIERIILYHSVEFKKRYQRTQYVECENRQKLEKECVWTSKDMNRSVPNSHLRTKSSDSPQEFHFSI